MYITKLKLIIADVVKLIDGIILDLILLKSIKIDHKNKLFILKE